MSLSIVGGVLCVPVSAAAEATDELASNDIPAEVEAQLKEIASYDQIIKIYTLGMYFHDFAEDMTVEEVIAADGAEAEYVTFTSPAFSEKEIRYFRYQDGEWQDCFQKTVYSRAKIESWLPDALSASYLQIEGMGSKKITNIYCLDTNSPPRMSTIVYEAEGERYYAVYNQINPEDNTVTPTYYAEADFYAYVKAWLANYRRYSQFDAMGNALDGGGGAIVDADPLHFNPLDVTLRKTAMPIWLLPVGITLGVVALGGGIAALVIVHKRKKKPVQEE